MRAGRTSWLAAPLALALLLTPALASAGRGLPGLLTQLGGRHPFAVRPTEVIYTGDASGVLGGSGGTGLDGHFGRLRWSSWKPRGAYGTGVVWLNNCEPSCAGGRYEGSAVQLHAFAAQGGHFTRLTLRYSYRGTAIVDELGIRRFSPPGEPKVGSYGYYTVRRIPPEQP